MALDSLDMLVDLYQPIIKEVNIEFKIKRVLSPSSDKVIEFVKDNFFLGWGSEVKAALYKTNPSCFIATNNHEIIGFACYDATAKGYFGPTGVSERYRGKGIGKALLLKCLVSMRNEGYGYAIIGGVEPNNWAFYEKACGANTIQNSKKIYSRMI